MSKKYPKDFPCGNCKYSCVESWKTIRVYEYTDDIIGFVDGYHGYFMRKEDTFFDITKFKEICLALPEKENMQKLTCTYVTRRDPYSVYKSVLKFTCDEFDTYVQEKFVKNFLKTDYVEFYAENGKKNSLICVYQHDNLIGIVLPIKVLDKDKF